MSSNVTDYKERAKEIVESELDEMMSPREYAATKKALIKSTADLAQSVHDAREDEISKLHTAISEANWQLSRHVDAGGGMEALAKWAQLAYDWHKVSVHKDKVDAAIRGEREQGEHDTECPMWSVQCTCGRV